MTKLQALLAALKLEIKKLLAYLPSKLPAGKTEMHKFMDDVIEISGKFAEVDSMKFAMASMVLRLDTTTSRVSKQYFAKALRKAAANQVVSVILNDIKEAQQAAMAAQQAALAEANKLDQEAAATAPQGTASGQDSKTTN
jgi:hypothetical protein